MRSSITWPPARQYRENKYGLVTKLPMALCLVASLLCNHSLAAETELPGDDSAEARASTDSNDPPSQHVDVTDAPKKFFVIPYPYYNAVTDATAGIVFGSHGYIQPQVKAFANFIYSSNDSKIAYLEVSELQIWDRFFADLKILTGHWGAVDLYLDRSNDSSKDDFITIGADDDWVRLELRYLLPIGHGKDKVVNLYRERDGTVDTVTASGGDSFNPLTSGRTFLELNPFYRSEDLESVGEFVTSGVSVGVNYDNRDWDINPSRGSQLKFHYKKDWGNLSNSISWHAYEIDFSKYWSFGSSKNFRQRVLAFDLWSVYIPTWDDVSIEDGRPVPHRPPPFAGETLGGWDRFRGYPTNRFEDEAAIDYQLEYRVVPNWNPFPSIPLINKLDIPWWQLAAFVEVGRVAPEWEVQSLHEDMRWNVGGGLRAFVNGLLIRIDLAGSEEGGEVQMIVDQPF